MPAVPASLPEERNTLLAPSAVTRSPASIGDDHQTYLNAIEEHYLGH